jgi:hypothetical protein
VAKLALLQAWVCVSACAACKCANVRLAKIELKKMYGWENKKYRRVVNKCRLTRCPFEILSVCSLVKMVDFLFSRQFDVVVSVFTLAANSQIYATTLENTFVNPPKTVGFAQLL